MTTKKNVSFVARTVMAVAAPIAQPKNTGTVAVPTNVAGVVQRIQVVAARTAPQANTRSNDIGGFLIEARLSISYRLKGMPQLLEHIDAIARKLKRGVLFISFDEHLKDSELSDWLDFDYETSEMRKTIIDWLDTHKIEWRECGGFASISVLAPYTGQIYVDVPYDDNLPIYKALESYLENPDGTMRFHEVGFYYCSLEKAMTNAEHDETGFWDRWAENF